MIKRLKTLLSIGVLSLSMLIPGTVAFSSDDTQVAASVAETYTESDTDSQPAAAEEPSQPETPAPEPSQPETPALEPSQPETPALEPSQPETPAPEPSQPETPAPEPSQPETPAPEPSQPETPAPEPSQPETPAPEPSQPETPAPSETEKQTEKQTETTEAEKQVETEKQTEKSTETEKAKESEPKQDDTLHTVSDVSDVKISGFSVDPSKYPSANITENTNRIYQYLVTEMKLNHAAACGVLANIQCESNFNPLAQGDSGSSYGICQWHNGRFSNLMSYCNGSGSDYNTLSGQLSYMQHELTSSYNGVWGYIHSVPDSAQGAYDAAYYWCVYFETPDHTYERAAQRGNLAKNEYYGKTFGTPAKPENTIIATVRSDMERKEQKELVSSIRTQMELQNRVAALANKEGFL